MPSRTAPPPIDPPAAPMPIILGSPRSGTTLLRLMLDAHPALAIPPETGFLLLPAADDAESFLRALTSYPADSPGWADYGLSADGLRARLDALPTFAMASGFRLFYRMYAERFGKSRWGDKTPIYTRHMPALERLLPEAHFIHLIRDGRDAALSLRRQWFSPGADIETQARYWHDNVSSARAQSSVVRNYLEVRYEDLVRAPATQLRRICDFIAIDYDAHMLRYHEGATRRLQEHAGRAFADGRRLSAEDRHRQQASSALPLDPTRIGAWKASLDADEQRRFAGIAGDLLRQLGYHDRGNA